MYNGGLNCYLDNFDASNEILSLKVADDELICLEMQSIILCRYARNGYD
jgi:hypothetical protein